MRSAEFDATQRLVARKAPRAAGERLVSLLACSGPPLADVEFGMTESNKEDAVTVFLSVEPAHPLAAIERRSL
jgi:hypothetical protein